MLPALSMSRNQLLNITVITLFALMFICLNYFIGCLGEDHFESKSATMFVTVFMALLLARLSAGKPQQIQKGLP